MISDYCRRQLNRQCLYKYNFILPFFSSYFMQWNIVKLKENKPSKFWEVEKGIDRVGWKSCHVQKMEIDVAKEKRSIPCATHTDLPFPLDSPSLWSHFHHEIKFSPRMYKTIRDTLSYTHISTCISINLNRLRIDRFFSCDYVYTKA